MMQIKIKNQHFDILPQKALFWIETQTLLIADLHLGKITHFRKEGIALPGKAALNNFERLDTLLQLTRARRIIFLGDLFHDRYNAEWDLFVQWRNSYPDLELIMVAGNHDVLPGWMFTANRITVYETDFTESGFIFTHHPKETLTPENYVFAGHIHPVYRHYGKARQSIRLPCFIFDPCQAILPSFGVFTGGHGLKMIPKRKIYVSTEEHIFAVPEQN